MNILRWLFERRIWTPKDETQDHRQDLVKLGYTMKKSALSVDGLRDYWIADNGIRTSETMHNLAYDEALLARRVYANAEWERLQTESE